MHYLKNMAAALLRWSESHTVSRPLCIATAREMMLLAEAELKVGAMSRFAASGSSGPTVNDLQSLYDALRRSTRDIAEMSRALSVSEKRSSVEPSGVIRSEVGRIAVEKLHRLATVCDQIGDHDLADGIDGILDRI